MIQKLSAPNWSGYEIGWQYTIGHHLEFSSVPKNRLHRGLVSSRDYRVFVAILHDCMVGYYYTQYG